MCLFFSFLPATFWAIIGYFVLFASTKTEGFVSKFGKVLAIWTFIIALFFPIMGAYVTISGICPLDEMLQTMNQGLEY